MENKDKNQPTDKKSLSKEADDAFANNNENLKGTEEGYYSSPPDKYLANEQPGVTYTSEADPLLLNSDKIEDGTDGNTGTWDSDARNSRNADAFNQDENVLDDNIDLDEDQSQSISSDDI